MYQALELVFNLDCDGVINSEYDKALEKYGFLRYSSE